VFDFLVGSTTHGVLRKARCPVLVVPMTGETAGRET
jgi:nucleotide-binding universal stress UspA family protein